MKAGRVNEITLRLLQTVQHRPKIQLGNELAQLGRQLESGHPFHHFHGITSAYSVKYTHFLVKSKSELKSQINIRFVNDTRFSSIFLL